MSESILKFDRTCSATEQFIRDYAEKMRHPASHILSVVGHSDNPHISPKELDTIQRLIKDIDGILGTLMQNLERDGATEN